MRALPQPFYTAVLIRRQLKIILAKPVDILSYFYFDIFWTTFILIFRIKTQIKRPLSTVYCLLSTVRYQKYRETLKVGPEKYENYIKADKLRVMKSRLNKLVIQVRGSWLGLTFKFRRRALTLFWPRHQYKLAQNV